MPRTLPGTDTITRAVELASRAPSLHNSQPWRLRYDGVGLKLYSDRTRLIPATDISGRELLLSCGAMLDHLQVAMSGMGYRTLVERFPNPNDPHFLARLEFASKDFVTDGDRARLEAMSRRYTDRLPLNPPPGWSTFEAIVRPLLGDVIFTVVPDESRGELANASGLTEAMRRYDSRYHAELHWWTGHTVTTTGVPPESLASPAERVHTPISRAFPSHERTERRADVVEDRARIVVLSTDADTALDTLRCGEALSTVLLEATLAGYGTCPLTHLVELASSRSIVQKLVGSSARPQILIRIGAAPESDLIPVMTPRRPVAEILEIAGH